MLKQRRQQPDAPTNLSEVASEIARLRGKVESRSSEMLGAISGLEQTQQRGIMSVLGAMGSLIGRIERLAPGAIPAAAADATAKAAMSRPPSAQSQPSV